MINELLSVQAANDHEQIGLTVYGHMVGGRFKYFSYQKKPSSAEAGRITMALRSAGPIYGTAAQIVEMIRRGGVWCGACFEPSADVKFGHAPFIGQQLFAVDVDNGEKHGNVFTPYEPGHPGFLDPLDAVERAYSAGLEDAVFALYFTMSADANKNPAWVKYRLVFNAHEQITDIEKAKGYTRKLQRFYPESDRSCKNIGRLFYGSNGEVWDYTGVMNHV